MSTISRPVNHKVPTVSMLLCWRWYMWIRCENLIARGPFEQWTWTLNSPTSTRLVMKSEAHIWHIRKLIKKICFSHLVCLVPGTHTLDVTWIWVTLEQGQNSLIITCAVYGDLTWLYLCVTYWFSPAVVHAPIVSRVVICGGWRWWGVQWLTTWRTRACAPRTKLNMLRLPLQLPCLTLQLWPMNYSLGDKMRPCASLSFYLWWEFREESFRQPRTVTTIIADFIGSL